MAKVMEVMAAGTAPGTAQAIVSTYSAVTAAGTTQGTATALPAAVNFSTAAASQTGVLLPTGGNAITGDEIKVFTTSSTATSVYPGGSDTINGSTSAFSVAQNKMAIFVRVSSTGWGAIVTA